ncbi:MAG: polysaccharide pyruvyl transferase family protein, partial [Candidatus Coatesbacteria bacterium]|nr:polysaccharide pyruvyl transferase family protein [Candidatus Coatesbacteria bacterium]
ATEKGKGILKAIRSIPSTMRELKKADILVWGGGQLLQDISSRLYIPFHTSRLALAILLKKPAFVHSIGAGPIKSKLDRLLTRLLLNRASAVTVRDRYSAEVLESCGIDAARITEVPDPALVLRPDECFDACSYLKGLGLDLARPTLGVAVRRLFHRGHGLLPIKYKVKLGLISSGQRARFEEFKCELARFADYVISRFGFQVLFIPMYSEAGQNDQGVGREIASLASQRADIFHLPVGLECRKVLSIISRMKAMVAVRMHAAVLSAVANVPLLSIHYASKGKSFMSDIGLADYTLAAEDMACDILVRKFSDLITNYDEIKSVLLENVRTSSMGLLANVSRIRQILGMGPLAEELVHEFMNVHCPDGEDGGGLADSDLEFHCLANEQN